MPKGEFSQLPRKRSAKTAEGAKKPVRSQASPSVHGATPAASGDGPATISPDERIKMIEICAYYRAVQRSFAHGSPEQDWVEAEVEVDRALGGGQ